jgi:tRNA-Thr(GGU) m(6)t(6)A37 methyltransferase TsaA
MTIAWTPIGVVRSTRLEPHDDGWDHESSHIVLADHIPADTLRGLETFSHVIVVYHFHGVDGTWESSRHPRGNAAWPVVGIFAQRAKDRPNAIGVTVARVQRVDDRTLWLEGLDAIDGTPVLDIKPWMDEFGPRGDVVQPSWSRDLMTTYWETSPTVPGTN